MDEVVFQRFVDGDDAAFTFIYNKYVDLLLQYGRSLGFEKEVLKMPFKMSLLNYILIGGTLAK